MSKNIFTIIIFFTLKRLFKNFLLVQLIKLSLFINALCAVALINLKFLVNLDFVPHVVKNMLLFGLIKLLLLSLILSIELYFLPFQKKFTIPKEIREFFFYDRTLLTKLTYAVNDIFKYQFNNIKSKNQRVHKIGRYSKKYFTNSDILHYGLITVIHTFGRDLKWNPHIHAIVTLGGFNKNYKYLNKRYFHVDSIAGQWKKLVIDIVKSGNYKNKKLKKKAQIIASSLYKKDTRFFFDVAKNDLNNNVSAIKYIGRYLSRAPIAEYKILDFSDNKVTFYYEDLSNNKEKVEITMEVEEFHILIYQKAPFVGKNIVGSAD